MRPYLENLTDEQRHSIYSEINTNEEELKNSVQYLQEWFRQEPHLPDFKGLYF